MEPGRSESRRVKVRRRGYGSLRQNATRRAHAATLSGALLPLPPPSLVRVTVFDRHLARRLLMAYAGFVLVLIPVFIVLHYVEYVDDMLDGGAEMGQVFRVYYPNYVPEIVRLTSPLALFLAVVVVTGRLAQSNQVMALHSAGVSLGRLLRTYALVALAVTALLFYVGGWVVPPSQRIVTTFDERYLNDAQPDDGPGALYRQNAPGQFVSVERYERAESTAYRVTLLRYDGARLAARLDADQMRWAPDSASARAVWSLANGTERLVDSLGGERRLAFAERDTALNLLPRDLAQSARDADGMTVPEARAYVDAVARTGSSAVDAPRTAYVGKFTYPLAHVVLVLLGVPFAARRQRGGQTLRIAVALFVASVYLALQRVVEPMGANGRIDPLVAMLLPHAAFLVIAAVVAWRATRV